MTNAQHIRNVIADLVTDFAWNDRKDDEDLPIGAIEDAIASGDITLDEIIQEFRKQLISCFDN